MTTGLEPVISCVTGRRINHLSYIIIFTPFLTCPKTEVPSLTVRKLQRASCLLSVTIRLSWASTRRFHQISLAGWIKSVSTLSILNRFFIFQGSPFQIPGCLFQKFELTKWDSNPQPSG